MDRSSSPGSDGECGPLKDYWLLAKHPDGEEEYAKVFQVENFNPSTKVDFEKSKKYVLHTSKWTKGESVQRRKVYIVRIEDAEQKLKDSLDPEKGGKRVTYPRLNPRESDCLTSDGEHNRKMLLSGRENPAHIAKLKRNAQEAFLGEIHTYLSGTSKSSEADGNGQTHVVTKAASFKGSEPFSQSLINCTSSTTNRDLSQPSCSKTVSTLALKVQSRDRRPHRKGNPSKPNACTPKASAPNPCAPSPCLPNPSTSNQSAFQSSTPSPCTPNASTSHPSTPNPSAPNLSTPKHPKAGSKGKRSTQNSKTALSGPNFNLSLKTFKASTNNNSGADISQNAPLLPGQANEALSSTSARTPLEKPIRKQANPLNISVDESCITNLEDNSDIVLADSDGPVVSLNFNSVLEEKESQIRELKTKLASSNNGGNAEMMEILLGIKKDLKSFDERVGRIESALQQSKFAASHERVIYWLNKYFDVCDS